MREESKTAQRKGHEAKANVKTPDLNKELPTGRVSEEVPNYSLPRKLSSPLSPKIQTIRIGLGVDSQDNLREASTKPTPVPLCHSVDSNYQLQPLTFGSSHRDTNRYGDFDFGPTNAGTSRGQHYRAPSTESSPVFKRSEGPNEEERSSVESIDPDVLGWTDAAQSSPESDYVEQTWSQESEDLSAARSLRCQMPGHANLSEHLRSSSRHHHWGCLVYDEERERNFCNACYESMPNLKDRTWRSVATSPNTVESVVDIPERSYPNLNSRFNIDFKLSQSPQSSSPLAGRRRGVIGGTSSAASSRTPSSTWSEAPGDHIVACLPESKGTRPSFKLDPMTRTKRNYRSPNTSVSSVVGLRGVNGWSPSDKQRVASGFHELIDEIDELVRLYYYHREEGHMIEYLEYLGIKREVDGSY